MITDAATRNRLKDTINGYMNDTLTAAQAEHALAEIVATPREACIVILTMAKISAEFLKDANLVPERSDDTTYGFMVGGHSDDPEDAVPVRTFGQILVALLNDDAETAHTIAHETSNRLSTTIPVVGYAFAFLYRSCHTAFPTSTQED